MAIRTRTAHVFATAIEIHCPDRRCLRTDPIPGPDGGFQWLNLPETVKCPDCGKTFKVSKRIEF